MTDVGQDVIRIAHNRLVREMPPQIHECLGILDDGQIWWRANDTSNSIGNLVVHLCGSLRHFVGRGIGGSDYVRDREAEFAERGPLPKAALTTLLEGTVAETDRVLTSLTPERLHDTTRNIETAMPVVDCLMRMSHHWAYHVGQIVFATKLLRQGSVNDLFRRTMVK